MGRTMFLYSKLMTDPRFVYLRWGIEIFSILLCAVLFYFLNPVSEAEKLANDIKKKDREIENLKKEIKVSLVILIRRKTNQVVSERKVKTLDTLTTLLQVSAIFFRIALK